MFGDNTDINIRILDKLADAVVITDNQAKILFWNKKAEEIFLYKKEEIIGKNALILVSKSLRSNFRVLMNKFRNKPGGPYVNKTVEITGIKKGGEEFEIEMSTSTEMINNVRVGIVIVRDITQRKINESLMREYSLFNDSIIVNAQEGIIILDKNLNFILWNRYLEKLTGVNSNEVIGKRIDAIFPEIKSNEIIKNLSKLKINTNSSGKEMYLKIPQTGYEGWANCIFSPYMNGNNRVSGILGIITDITESKKYEEMLIKNKAFLQSIIENVPIAIFAKDENGRFIVWNKKSESIFKLKTSEVIGKTDYNFFTKEQSDQFRKKDLEVLRNNKLVNIPEEIVNTGSGEERILHTIKVPLIGKNDQSSILLGISEDITERKKDLESLEKSEKRYRSLFENMIEGYALCKLKHDKNDKPIDFVYLDTNKAFEKITGLRNVNGKNICSIIPDIQITNPDLFEIYNRVSLTKKNEYFESFIPQIKKWIAVSVYSSEFPFFTAVFNDITQRKQSEIEINNKIEENEKLNSFFVDRELKMIELKEKITSLEKKIKQEEYKE